MNDLNKRARRNHSLRTDCPTLRLASLSNGMVIVLHPPLILPHQRGGEFLRELDAPRLLRVLPHAYVLK